MSEKSRRRFGLVCWGIAIVLIVVGMATLSAFFRSKWQGTPAKLPPQPESADVIRNQ